MEKADFNLLLGSTAIMGAFWENARRELSRGTQSKPLFLVLSAVVVVMQLLMLVYGRLVGLAVEEKAAACMGARNSVILHSNAGGPLLRMYTVLLSPTHSRRLTKSSSHISMACVPALDAAALAADIQHARISHLLVHSKLLQADGAIIPDRLEDRRADEVPGMKDDEFIILSASKYQGAMFLNYMASSSLVPIDVGTGIPEVIASSPLAAAGARVVGRPQTRAPIVCVVLAWRLQD